MTTAKEKQRIKDKENESKLITALLIALAIASILTVPLCLYLERASIW